LRKWAVATLLGLVLVAVCGCQTIGFYSQALKGQYGIFAHQKPIAALLADSQTPALLKQRLEVIQALRQFAQTDLQLRVDGHYRKYVDVQRPYVVWNVEAAPEFSLEPKSWWYPMVGRLDYRGYFSKPGAHDYAAILRRKHYDVYVGGVEAYSTLGWFKDPVLNTFIFNRDPELAEVIFHELAHQRVFARGDTDFNEAFATTVGQAGARRWLRKNRDTAASEQYEGQLRRNDQFVHLVMRTREKLEKLYGDQRTEEGKLKALRKPRGIPPQQLRQEKLQAFKELQKEYSKLKEDWGGRSDYDDWFAREINNAQLNSVAAYYDLVPSFERLLELKGGDPEKFYEAADRLAKMPKKERRQQLGSFKAGATGAQSR
jgi:predicted aminopeptidase